MSEEVIVENLQRRLGGLTASPSRESIQSLAKWMIFHRKHSIALANWMARQYSDDHCEKSSLEKRNKYYLYICVMHEIFIMYHPTTTSNSLNNNTMWERTSILRTELSQRVLLIAFKSIVAQKKDDDIMKQLIDEKIKPMIHTWKTLDCLLLNNNYKNDPFSYDDVLLLLDKINNDDHGQTEVKEDIAEEKENDDDVSSPPSLKKKEDAKDRQRMEEDRKEDKADDMDENVVESNLFEKQEEDVKSTMKGEEHDLTDEKMEESDKKNKNELASIQTQEPPSTNDVEMTSPGSNETANNDESSSTKKRKLEAEPPKTPSPPPQPQEVKFDFENSGMPFRQVGLRELMAPTKAIETMQIARDLRNDAAVQLSSLLSTLPDHVYQSLREGKSIDDNDDTENIFSDELLDINIQESLENIRMYRDICIKLQKSRQKCVDFLIQSRCQFGSMEAAKQFYQMDERIAKLKQKKSLLNDAMELEGIDFEDEDNNSDSHNENDNDNDSSRNDNDDDVMDIIHVKQKISRGAFFSGGTPTSGELEDLQWYLESLNNKKEEKGSNTPSS